MEIMTRNPKNLGLRWLVSRYRLNALSPQLIRARPKMRINRRAECLRCPRGSKYNVTSENRKQLQLRKPKARPLTSATMIYSTKTFLMRLQTNSLILMHRAFKMKHLVSLLKNLKENFQLVLDSKPQPLQQCKPKRAKKSKKRIRMTGA